MKKRKLFKISEIFFADGVTQEPPKYLLLMAHKDENLFGRLSEILEAKVTSYTIKEAQENQTAE